MWPISSFVHSLYLQFFSIAKTQFLNLAPFSENIQHKPSASSTIYKTSDSSCKMKLSPQNRFTCAQNQTLLSNQKQSDQNDIHYQAVSKQYTKKYKTRCSNIVLREKYIFHLKTNFIYFRHLSRFQRRFTPDKNKIKKIKMGRESVSEWMNENMFYHSSSKLIRNYTLLCNFFGSFSLYPYFYSRPTVPCISQTCPLFLWYCNSCSLLKWTCNQSKSIEQSVLSTNGKHNVQGHPFLDFLRPIFNNLLSELAYIGCVTWFETSEIYFDWLCLINDMCSLFVFHCCHLCSPVWMTCASECRMGFENENVFRVLLKSLSEICKLCFTMRNGLRYWQQTAQLAKWVQATANFVQPMGFSVLAIEKNCNINNT